MTRHRKTCTKYQQFMKASVRLAEQARRTALQARQQVVGAEESDAGQIQTDVNVSSAVISTQMVLTRRSLLALV